jgi:hypothetical protein
MEAVCFSEMLASTDESTRPKPRKRTSTHIICSSLTLRRKKTVKCIPCQNTQFHMRSLHIFTSKCAHHPEIDFSKSSTVLSRSSTLSNLPLPHHLIEPILTYCNLTYRNLTQTNLILHILTRGWAPSQPCASSPDQTSPNST